MATLEMSHVSLVDAQADFFDERPPLYPWPSVLRETGLRFAYKPREAFWRSVIADLGMSPGDRLLDVGCGTAIWLDRLQKQFGVMGSGIDVSLASLRSGRQSLIGEADLACADVMRLPYPDDHFDYVISLDVLEHVDRQDHCLEQLVRVLRPEGRILLWTLNRNQSLTWNWFLQAIGVDVFDRVAHDPELLPDPNALKQTLEELGIVLERVELFNSFFTLAADELVMCAVYVLERLGLFDSAASGSRALGRLFFTGANAVVSSMWRLLHALDFPWRWHGRSNGVLLIGIKAATNSPFKSRSEH